MTSYYQTVVLGDSPVLLWALNDTSGTTVTDLSGNGHSGTYTGGYTLASAAGPVLGGGNAVLLNGTTGYIGAAASYVGPSAYPWSIEVWVNCDNLTTGNYASFICQGIPGSDNSGWQIQNDYGSYNFIAGNGTTQATAAGGSLAANGWVYLAGTFDGTTLTLYVNGVSTATAALAGYAADGTEAVTSGAENGASNFFNGLLAWVAVYPTALTGTQVSNHYNAAPLAPLAGPPPVLPYLGGQVYRRRKAKRQQQMFPFAPAVTTTIATAAAAGAGAATAVATQDAGLLSTAAGAGTVTATAAVIPGQSAAAGAGAATTAATTTAPRRARALGQPPRRQYRPHRPRRQEPGPQLRQPRGTAPRPSQAPVPRPLSPPRSRPLRRQARVPSLMYPPRQHRRPGPGPGRHLPSPYRLPRGRRPGQVRSLPPSR